MKSKIVTKSDAKHYLERTLDLKEKLNNLNSEKAELDSSIKLVEDKISRRLGIYKKLKEKAVDREDKPLKIITDYSSNVEVSIKKIVGRNLHTFIRKEFPAFRKICLNIQEFIDDIEIWCSVKYRGISEVVRYTIRLIKKLPGWIVLLYNDYDWGFSSIIPILEFKLNKLQECLKNGHYIGCENEAKEVLIAIEHIKRYQNIEKYTETCDYDPVLDKWEMEVCQVDGEGRPAMYTHREKDPWRSKQRCKVFMEQKKLSAWHYKKLWSLISKCSQKWID